MNIDYIKPQERKEMYTLLEVTSSGDTSILSILGCRIRLEKSPKVNLLSRRQSDPYRLFYRNKEILRIKSLILTMFEGFEERRRNWEWQEREREEWIKAKEKDISECLPEALMEDFLELTQRFQPFRFFCQENGKSIERSDADWRIVERDTRTYIMNINIKY